MRTVTREQARQIVAAKAASKVPGAVRQQIQREAIASQRVDLSKFYYSRVRFAGTITEGGVLTFAAQKRYAFGYQLQREVDGHVGHDATYADTNLLEERTPNNGETVKIIGISCRPTPFTDAYLMNALDQTTSVILRINNDNTLILGNPSDVPGSSQNTSGPAWSIQQGAENYNEDIWQATQKGEAEMDNIMVLGEPIIWTPMGADAKMDVMFELNEQFIHTYPANRAATDVTALGAADLAVVTPYTQPTEAHEPGTFVDFFVKLYVSTESPRSLNS